MYVVADHLTVVQIMIQA